jgi:hypothetical protein
VIIQLASPFLILFIISLKAGRQGDFALFSSSKVSIIQIPRLSAFFSITDSWSGIDWTCLSSHSEDLRAYKKYFSIDFFVKK